MSRFTQFNRLDIWWSGVGSNRRPGALDRHPAASATRSKLTAYETGIPESGAQITRNPQVRDKQVIGRICVRDVPGRQAEAREMPRNAADCLRVRRGWRSDQRPRETRETYVVVTAHNPATTNQPEPRTRSPRRSRPLTDMSFETGFRLLPTDRRLWPA